MVKHAFTGFLFLLFTSFVSCGGGGAPAAGYGAASYASSAEDVHIGDAGGAEEETEPTAYATRPTHAEDEFCEVATEACGTDEAADEAENYLVYETVRDYIVIQGVEYSTELTSLSLFGFGLTDEDIVDLSYMTNLTLLILNRNNISDVTPLSNLTNLTALRLSGNNISDLTPLSGLVNLTTLSLPSNPISDISPLSGLVNLTDLYIYDAKISDLTPLANLTELFVLDLESNLISDITPLSNLPRLGVLRLSFNQITDLSPLAELNTLITLELLNNPIEDWTPAEHVPFLEGRP